MPYTMPSEVAWCTATPYFPRASFLRTASTTARESRIHILSYTCRQAQESEINLTTAFSSRKRWGLHASATARRKFARSRWPSRTRWRHEKKTRKKTKPSTTFSRMRSNAGVSSRFWRRIRKQPNDAHQNRECATATWWEVDRWRWEPKTASPFSPGLSALPSFSNHVVFFVASSGLTALLPVSCLIHFADGAEKRNSALGVGRSHGYPKHRR